jgi:hypothetical protein
MSWYPLVHLRNDVLIHGCVNVSHRYKDMKSFIKLEKFLDGNLTIAKIHQKLRFVYDANYAPEHPPVSAVAATTNKGKKKRKSIMDDDDESDDEGSVPAVHVDELEQYLSYSTANLKKVDPLLWWKENEYRFPTVALMARNYLGCPASTGGLERMFSSAGSCHDALKKNTKETTLETRLMAKYNYSV